MTREQKFYNALKDIFVGAKVEGESGYINLMRIKSRYFEKGVFPKLQEDIEKAIKPFPDFKEELFDKLYTFFQRYFSESGSIYFRYTPIHQNVYEKVYTDDKDVILFWKTHMLYYVKTDRLFKNLEVEIDDQKFFFDVSTLEHKKANEKKEIIFEFKEKREDGVPVFSVSYSERGRKTKIEDILKSLKKEGIKISADILERAFRIFKKQSEVDYFINKNAKEFLREQFNIWLYQYIFSGESEWTEKRIKQLQVLKDIAFKIIDFISQFEDELVKIWNKPKFVLNSNYVITLDRIWKNSPSMKGWQAFPSERGVDAEGGRGVSNKVVKWHQLPYNPKLKEKARALRKAGILSEVLFWQQVKNKQFLGLDFDRQKIIGNYIVDFYCKDLGIVVEIDGVSHDYKGDYDKNREEYLKSLGLRVIHILDKDIKKNLDGVMKWLKREIMNTPSAKADTPLKEGMNTPSAKADTPLKEGNLIEKIIKHKGMERQIKEWKELGMVDENFKPSDILVIDLMGKHLNPKYKHLPIDTRYFKDLEPEILGLFDDLDNSLDGWLIKSENYQALNTILPKFKEKVQTIYIDPPFNKEQDADYFYSVKYKDSAWITLLENRLRLAKDILNERGSIFVRCDYNGNWLVRPLMKEIFGEENFKNEISISRSGIQKEAKNKFLVAVESLFLYSKNEDWKPKEIYEHRETDWMPFVHYPGERQANKERVVFSYSLKPPKGRHWGIDQDLIDKWSEFGWIRFRCKNCGYEHYHGDWEKCPKCGSKDFIPEIKNPPKKVDSNWTNIQSYSQDPQFPTRNAEELLKRVIESTSNEGDLIMDFFLGSGTTIAVAHKLKRKWIGVEMGEHFYTVVLPRMKKVLFYDKSGISKLLKTPRQTSSDTPLKEGNYQGGGFFKYYELEQYEDTLRKVKYEDSDLSSLFPSDRGVSALADGVFKDPYNQYVFMRDLKMLEALEVDYENNKVKVDLSKLYSNVDIPETLSNLLGKWIKRITSDYVEFEDGEKIDLKNLDYKLIKPLIWW